MSAPNVQRLIHLFDRPDTLAMAMVRQLLVLEPLGPQQVWTVGRAEVAEAARDVGLHVDVHLTAGDALRSWSLVRRQIRGQLRGQAGGTQTIYHGWSPRIAAVAAMAGARRVIATAMTAEMSSLTATILRRRAAAIVAFSPQQHDALLPPFAPPHVKVMQPVVGDIGAGDRAALRRRWDVDDSTRIVLAVGGDARDLDAMQAMLAVGLAAETGRPVRLLIHPDARGIDRARRMNRASGRESLLIADEVAAMPWQAAAGVDMALALSDGPGLSWAMHAGLPIVAPRTPAMAGRLCHEETALLTSAASPGQLARAINELADDPALARRLGDSARTAAARFAPAVNLPSWQKLYG